MQFGIDLVRAASAHVIKMASDEHGHAVELEEMFPFGDARG